MSHKNGVILRTRRSRYTPSALLRVTYDPKANVAMIYLTHTELGGTVSHGIVNRKLGPILHYDAHNHITEIEVLFARENLPARLLDAAERAGGVLELLPTDE